MKIEKLYARDIIALVFVTYGLYLISQGIDGFVTAFLFGILGYYFSKRYREEGNESKELDAVIKKIGERIKQKKEMAVEN